MISLEKLNFILTSAISKISKPNTNPFHKNVFRFSSKIYFILYMMVLLLASGIIHAQESEMKFEIINPERGLSQSTVHAILQDSYGFIWFGTEDGLNKYDGYNFTIYRHAEKDSNSISDNFIWEIYEDSENNLWIGTSNGGLNLYDRAKNVFTHFQHDPTNPKSISQDDVRTIFEDSNKNLWIGTNNGGLNKFNKLDESFTIYKNSPTDPNSISNNSIRDIVEDRDGNLWIGTNGGGLNKFNKALQKFTRYIAMPGNPNSISGNFVWSLHLDDNQMMWIGVNGRGLNKLDPYSMKFTLYQYESDKNSLINNNVTTIKEDKNGLLWIGTESGLSIFNKTKNEFVNVRHDPLRPTSLSNNLIRSIIEDQSGLIWIGTVGGGVNKYNPHSKRFVHYQNDPSDQNSLSSNMIRAVFEDSRGILWVGTLGGGLNRFDKDKNIVTRYLSNENVAGSLNDNRITSIYEDSKNTLWVGTWGSGLNKSVNTNNGSKIEFTYYVKNPNKELSIPSDTIQAIYEDSFKNLWVGTEAGLSVFINDKNNFFAFEHDAKNQNSLSDDRIQSKCIYEDMANNLWIGTWNGLNRISSLKKFNSGNVDDIQFISYKSDISNPNSLSDNRIISIYEDPSSTKERIVLWVGTVSGGLNKMEISKEGEQEKIEFNHYTEKNGLPNNAIYSILGDEKGNLWVSTNNGLSKFNPKDRTFRNYNESDGLQSDQFYWGASFKSESGEMFFGGVNGLTAFYPSDLKDNQHVPKVYITDLQLFNKPVPISEDSPLNVSLLETDAIELDYDSYVITFEYVALDYTVPEKNQYTYMLEGYDKHWIPGGNKRFVTYSKIDAGEYVFRVKGSNNDGVWNEEGASLKITILPPFWSSVWFISLLILLFGGAIVYLFTTRIKQMLAVERLRTKIAADLHDNIGSSLTEISILSEVISQRLKNEDESIQKKLKRISEDSRSLIDKMSDIVWLVNPQRDTLYDLILRLEDTYSELLAMTNISFTSKNLKSLEKVSLSMEQRQHLFLIFKEGINNCLTHGECTQITLDAHLAGKSLEMILTDNGTGFNSDQKFMGNGLKNMHARAKQIGGTLIINSEIGKGTTLIYKGKIN